MTTLDIIRRLRAETRDRVAAADDPELARAASEDGIRHALRALLDALDAPPVQRDDDADRLREPRSDARDG